MNFRQVTESDFENALKRWNREAGKALERVLDSGEVSRTELAAKMGVSVSALSYYQRVGFSLHGVIRLALATGQEIFYLKVR